MSYLLYRSIGESEASLGCVGVGGGEEMGIVLAVLSSSLAEGEERFKRTATEGFLVLRR
jgi:hypothetical protein